MDLDFKLFFVTLSIIIFLSPHHISQTEWNTTCLSHAGAAGRWFGCLVGIQNPALDLATKRLMLRLYNGEITIHYYLNCTAEEDTKVIKCAMSNVVT